MCSKAVAKIVDVSQRHGADNFQHIAKARLARVERTVVPIRVWNAPSHVAGTQLVEMAVAPAHRGLDCQMQAVEPDGERHLDPAQHHRLDIVERDLETGNGVGTHAARLRRPFSAAQRHGSSAARSVIL